jgi:uncharacterized cupin superfamily protein
MPKIDQVSAPRLQGSRYPPPHHEPCIEREALRLGDAVGLSQFGVNLVTLPPGCWASQRHWHAKEDEFVWMLEGELVLIEDGGETLLRAGDCAGWKGGVKNGHHLVNRSDAAARFLVVGSRDDEDHGEYPDIDMKFLAGRYSGGGGFSRKDGTKY